MSGVSYVFWTYIWPTSILQILFVLVPLLLSVAYYTYAERKVLAYSQLRKGPNVVGPFGLLQPIADFYRTDPISRASPTMAECSALFVTGAETARTGTHG